MSLKQRLNKMGATPGKLALVGVLTLVLILVVMKQLPQSAPESIGSAPEVAQSTKAEKVNPTNGTTKKAKAGSDLAAWPEIDLAVTLANDPFALPIWAVKEELPEVIATNEGPGELDELQEQGTSIVVIGKTTKSATIGEQKLHVGDILEGYQITDITTQGIYLNKLDPR